MAARHCGVSTILPLTVSVVAAIELLSKSPRRFHHDPGSVHAVRHYSHDGASSYGDVEAPFLYRCPNTGFRVQVYSPKQTPDDDD